MAPCSDSLSLRLASKLNLAAGQQLAGSFYKRHAVTALRLLRLLAGARFQVLFHSPPGVLFTFPSRYLCAIGHRRVFRLGWWSTQVRTGFLVPGPTQGCVRSAGRGAPTGLSPCAAGPPRPFGSPSARPPGPAGPGRRTLQPRRGKALPCAPARRFGHGPLPLAATRGISQLISSPPGT